MAFPVQTRSIAGSWLLAALGCLCGASQAAVVRISVSDATGSPLPQAVVLLESVSAKPSVKPMPTVEVSQLKRQFRPQVTLLTVGTPVVFSNFDTVRHHVYSFSPAKTFELKLYAGVPNQPVVFDKPGVSIVGCNIHDQMAAWIVVADTPLHGLSDAQGQVRIDAVAAGNYRMWVWHPGLPALTEGVVSSLTVGQADLDQPVQLSALAAPQASKP
jgi:plastocyanin